MALVPVSFDEIYHPVGPIVIVRVSGLGWKCEAYREFDGEMGYSIDQCLANGERIEVIRNPHGLVRVNRENLNEDQWTRSTDEVYIKDGRVAGAIRVWPHLCGRESDLEVLDLLGYFPSSYTTVLPSLPTWDYLTPLYTFELLLPRLVWIGERIKSGEWRKWRKLAPGTPLE